MSSGSCERNGPRGHLHALRAGAVRSRVLDWFLKLEIGFPLQNLESELDGLVFRRMFFLVVLGLLSVLIGLREINW